MNLLDFLADKQAQADVRRRTGDMLGAGTDRRFWRDVASGGANAVNRGLLASNLGVPVDMLNAAMGGLGGESPVGGADWLERRMQRYGMVTPERNPAAESAMSTVGALAPFAAPTRVAGALSRVFARPEAQGMRRVEPGALRAAYERMLSMDLPTSR